MTDIAPSEYLLLHALADQELDAATALLLEARIAAEPALATEYARILALKERVKSLGKPQVSEDFAARIAAIGSDAEPAPRRTRILSLDHPSWRALAASVVLTVFIASGGTYLVMSPRGDTVIEDEIANGHRRSLLATSPTDVLSSDRHTVRPWFDQKLGWSPPTVDLSSEGFPLVGGRVEVIAGNPVPGLVYRRRQHLITVVAMPLAAGREQVEAPISKVVDGDNMVHWASGGFKYWAVSDLDADELSSFVAALRAK